MCLPDYMSNAPRIPCSFTAFIRLGFPTYLPDSRPNAQSWNAVSMQHAIQTDLLNAIHVLRDLASI